MLDLLADICRRREQELATRGVSLELVLPAKAGDRRAARIDAESECGLAQLLLWETGELDLVIGSSFGEVILDEHREVSTALGIEDAFDTIEAHLTSEESGR